MKFKFNYIEEKDIDLLIIEEFANNKDFSNVFLNSIGVFEYEIIEIAHSVSHPRYGETDIQILYMSNDEVYALLIEDKLNAIAMPDQAIRYLKRGYEGVKNGDYKSFEVFICAPQKYLDSNEEADKYANKISYEKLLEILKEENSVNKQYKRELLIYSLSKKNASYNPIVNDIITSFWSQLYDYIDENYPNFIYKKIKSGRGENAN